MTHALVITRHVPAPPPELYAAWLTPEGLSRWWWVGIGDTTDQVDERVGGDYLIQSQAAGIGVRGTFVRLEEPGLLELTWTWLEAESVGPEEIVRVELTAQDAGTLVTVTHHVDDADGVEPYRQGWDHVLGNLSRAPQHGHLQTHDPAGPHHAITLTQVVPAPRSVVYAAWLEPQRLATWWWPEMDTTYVIEARRPDDVVTVTFTDQDDGGSAGTLVTLVHEFAVPQADTAHPTQGWTAVLASLAQRSGHTD